MRKTRATSFLKPILSVSMFFLGATTMVACGDTKVASSPEKLISYKTYEDLPNCTEKHEGEVVEIEEDQSHYACTDGRWEKESASGIKLPDNIQVYKNEDDMPNCSSKKESELAFVEDSSVILVCEGRKWISLGAAFETEEDLPNCTENRDGMIAYVLNDENTFKCDDGIWDTQNNITNNNDDNEENKEGETEETDSHSGSSKPTSSSSSRKNSIDDDVSSNSKSSLSEAYVRPTNTDGLTLFALMYDSDQLVNPLFSTAPGYNETDLCPNPCLGVLPGMVKENLGTDRKPQFNSSSTNALSCAGSSTNFDFFNTLFNYTAGVNEIQGYNLKLSLDNETGTYSFNSDDGFFPLEFSTSGSVISSLSPTPCTNCREKRTSEQPPFWLTTIDKQDYYCNGPGWSGGLDCSASKNNFANGDYPAVWDWGKTRWKELRNHQFCMEINGNFTYKAGQEATFYSGGDLWVFVNGKLAVDLGGNHLPTYGKIDMDFLNGNYDNYMKTGRSYPIDIFFCARRASISVFDLNTNIKITQN